MIDDTRMARPRLRAWEVRPVSDTTRLRALTEAGLLHPNPDGVLAPLFTGGSGFFLASDKVQVKYEMLRARLVDGLSVSEVAAAHGYSRAAFYLVAAAFDQSGMAGLIDERRGPPWPGEAAPGDRGVHPRRYRLGSPDRRAGGRPVRGAVAPAHHRAGARAVSARSFWPPIEAAQVDYETLRAHVLEPFGLPEGLAAARFARRGLAGLIAWPSAEPVFVAELRRRCPSGLDTARRSARGGAGGGLPVPARRRRARGFGCGTGTTGRRPAVRAALYARVSTERQADRGTIGSQLALLREHIAAAGDELVGEYVDDGYSGARLDRPGLDALRDAAEAGLVERVWCLSPDRLARAYAYQVLVLDELDRFGVTVAFTDSPGWSPTTRSRCCSPRSRA